MGCGCGRVLCVVKVAFRGCVCGEGCVSCFCAFVCGLGMSPNEREKKAAPSLANGSARLPPPSVHITPNGRQAGRRPGPPPQGLHGLAHWPAHHPLLGPRRQLGVCAGGALKNEKKGRRGERDTRRERADGAPPPPAIRTCRGRSSRPAPPRWHARRVARWVSRTRRGACVTRPLAPVSLCAAALPAPLISCRRPLAHRLSRSLTTLTRAGPRRLAEAARTDLPQHDGR